MNEQLELDIAPMDEGIMRDAIAALEHGTSKHPVSWVYVGTYAGLMTGQLEETDRKKVVSAINGLISYGVPIGKDHGRYFINRQAIGWQDKVKSRLHDM